MFKFITRFFRKQSVDEKRLRSIDERWRQWRSYTGPPFPDEPIINIFCDEDWSFPVKPNQKPFNIKVNHRPGCKCFDL